MKRAGSERRRAYNNRQRTYAMGLGTAWRCEQAIGKTCRCRCGGKLHGAARVADPRTLPLEDPHSPSQVCRRCEGTGELRFPLVTVVCPVCHGKGRLILPRVLRAALPVGVEA